jgi:hypothetical protein
MPVPNAASGRTICEASPSRAIYRLTDFAFKAAAAESFRAWCGSVRMPPVCSSQASPIAAPQLVQGTDNACFGVSSLILMNAQYNVLQLRNGRYCSFSGLFKLPFPIAEIQRAKIRCRKRA